MPNLLGTAPNQVPTNADLGKLAFMDVVDTVTNNPYVDTAISDTKPSLLLDFANSKTLDPRITYTRASTASYYDGKTTAVAEQNLLTYSQEFDNAAWVKTSVTVTANSDVSPDGTTTADTFTATAANAVLGQVYTYTAGNQYTFSVWIKRKTGTGVVRITANGNETAGNPLSVDGTWQRFTQTVTSTVTNGKAGIRCDTSGDEVYIWGAQLEQRSSVSSYTPTTSSSITNYIPALQTAAAGVPRFDHDPVTGESKGFLIEEQRSNLLTYSSAFDNAAWNKSNVTVTADTAVAPDGTLSADKVVADSSASVHQVYVIAIPVASTAYSYSVYVKAGEVSTIKLNLGGSFNFSATYNLATGTVTSTNVTATITAVGNGWYRCALSGTSSGTTAGQCQMQLNGGTSYTGDGYSGLYIWGAQLEAGSFATSYIPTTSAQVTRSADAASMTGANFSSWYNQAEGSLYAESKNPVASAYSSISYISDSTTNNSIRLGQTAAGYSDFSVVVAGSASCSIQTITIANTSSKVAASYRANDFARSVNGAVVDIDTNGLLPSVTQLQIGTNPAGSALNGTIKRLAYYPKRLSDAELQEMTQ